MAEKFGGPVSYYLVDVSNPNQSQIAYQAECGDIIEALSMTFNEGCAFKAIWRTAAERTLGKAKAGGDAVYDAQKVRFYGARMEAQLTGDKPKPLEKPEPVAVIASASCYKPLKDGLRQRVRNLSFWVGNASPGYAMTSVDIEQLKTELRISQELLERFP
jgi:hypothetical protein